MNLKLSKEDIKKIEVAMAESPVANYLKNQAKLRFNIGDILIKKTSQFDVDDKVKWTVETTNYQNGLPRRYVYVYEDECGIGFVKRLKVSNGELGIELICLADTDTDSTRYEVDPLFLESMLIGDGTFDIKVLQKKEKEKKKEVAEFNKNASFLGAKISEINKYLMDNFKAGSTIYYHRDGDHDRLFGLFHDDVKINSIKEKDIGRSSSVFKENHQIYIDDKEFCDSAKYVEIQFINRWGHKDALTSFDMHYHRIYNNKPRSIMDQE